MRLEYLRQLLGTRLAAASYARATLLSYGLLDEIVAGLPIVGLPLIRDHLGLSYEQAGLLFTVGACSAMLLEPVINLLSDRGSKRLWILGGLLLLVLSFVLAGYASNYVMLLIAFALYHPAGSAAVGLAQAMLIDHDPAASTRTMTRWTLLSSVGDFLAPLAVAFIAGLQLGWPGLCWLAAAIWGGLFVVTALQRFPGSSVIASDQAGDNHESTRKVIVQALRNPVLLRWAVLALIPTMVDEVFLGFASLYLRDILHASQAAIGIILTIGLLGGLLGLTLLDRWPWLRRAASETPHRLLAGMAMLVLAAMVLFLSVRNVWLAGLALFVVSLGAAGWYPVAKARAYAQMPGRSGLVRTIVGLGAPFEMVLPGIVGVLAGQSGLLAGLALLGSAPLLILLALIGYKER
ncbi:MAG: MFS transporter [Ktedonobacteraceae bacterium]|nr:MFS transporter [Ktedonobacteraceae bacterium]